MFSPVTRVFVSNTRRACFAVVLLASPARAATISWDGDTDTTFQNANNWVGGVAPANSTGTDIAQFGVSLTSFLPTLTADRSINGLQFQKTDGGWTLGGTGTTLTLGATGVVDAATSGVTTLDPTIAFSSSRAFSTQGGLLKLNGGIHITGNASLGGTTGFVEVASISSTSSSNTFSKNAGNTVSILGAAQSGWNGAVSFASGTLRLGDKAALGGGTITWSNTSTLEALSNLSGSNAIANNWVIGPGVHTVGGSQSIEWSGSVTNSAGNRTLSNTLPAGALFTISGPVYLSETAGTGRTLTLNSSGSTGNTLISGNIADFNGSGTAGTLNVGSSASSGMVTLSGTNTYTGTTTVAGSNMLVLARTSAKAPGTVTAGGTAGIGLGVGGTGYYGETDVQNLFANTLSGFSLAAGTRIGIDTSAGNFTYSVNQGGSRNLTKLGTNTLTLTGSNTYSGGTSVTSGRLEVNNTNGSGTGSGTVTVNAGAFLAGEGSITTGSNNYVYINGTLQAGSTAATQGTDFSLSTSGMGGTVFGATSTAHFDLWSTTGTDQSSLLAAADMLRIFGDLTLTTGSTLKLGNPNNLTFQEGDVFRLFDWTSLGTRTGTFSTIDSADLNLGAFNLDTSNLYTTGTISIMGIPEPGRALLLILGLTGVTMRRRRFVAGL